MIKKLIFSIIFALIVFVAVDNDVFLYHEPVGQITAVATISKQNVADDFNNHDKNITQNLTIRLLNTSKRSQKITVQNIATQSQSLSQLYHKGQKVILQENNGHFTVTNLKRDAIIAATFALFLGLMISFVRWKSSLFLLVSLALNLIFFLVAVKFDLFTGGTGVLWIFSSLAIIFALISSIFVLGLTKQMLMTFITTILTTVVTFLLVFIVLSLTGNSGLHFEYLSYVTQNPTVFFFATSIISVLGAILDGTGDIVAGLFGMQRQNSDLTKAEYFKSGLTIGQEIIGTLTNVLFMIFIAETFPMTVLLLRNGNSWNYIAMIALNLGLLQTLIAAIGIVLTVPITSSLTSFVLGGKHE